MNKYDFEEMINKELFWKRQNFPNLVNIESITGLHPSQRKETYF
jgi:hypothetical protein